MPDKNADEIKIGKPRKTITGDSSDSESDQDKVSDYHKLSSQDRDSEKGLEIEHDPPPTGADPSIDFSSSDDINYESDPDDRLETTEVIDAVEPQPLPESDLIPAQSENVDMENQPPPEKVENSLSSTDKIYVIPDETVSSIERDELISNLQKKIPNIIKQKHVEQPPEPLKKRPEESWEKRLEREILQQPQDSEPEPEILPPAPPMSPENTVDGIAQFSGSRIYLPSIMKIKSGDEIIVRGKKFRAKKKAFEWKGIYLGTALGIIIILAVALVISRPPIPVIPGKVVGQVLNAKTGEVIPKAQVVINEQGKTLFTDTHGLFVIDGLDAGTWSISASKPQYKSAAVSFAHAPGATSILTLSLDPSVAVVEQAANRKEEKKEQSAVKEVAIPNYGQLTVIANIPQARVIVDNKILGPGNTTYSNITAGKHKLVVMAQGYKEFSGTVNIERNKNNKINVELEKIKTAYVPSEITFEEYLIKADAMASKGDWQEAIGNYTLALAKHEDGDAYYKRSRAYVQVGQQTQEINDLFKAAQFYTSEGRLHRSVESLNEILDWTPENAKAYRERGFAYLRLGDFEQAIDDLKEAIDIDDKDFDNHMALGEAYYIMGQHKDALKYLKKARNIDDSNARVYALAALASLARGDEGDAKKYFKDFEMKAGEQDRAEFARDPDWLKLSEIMSEYDD
ncbi:MAG TPA: tetratricopeptide repeat protein [candidate division Zixibacteria bacterium]|nr:tetratricopeptide repeat protein [candidate division Zixibacteria bacterium]